MLEIEYLLVEHHLSNIDSIVNEMFGGKHQGIPLSKRFGDPPLTHPPTHTHTHTQVLLHRATGDEGLFFTVYNSVFDHDLFLLSWGPTVAALSYVFDNAEERGIVQKAITGFRYVHFLGLS